MEQFNQTAHVGQISRRIIDRPPSRIGVGDYVLALAFNDAIYGGLKVFGIGGIPVSVYLIWNNDNEVFLLIGLVGLFLAGFGHYGQKRVESQAKKFDMAVRIRETNEVQEPVTQPPPTIPQTERQPVHIATLQGKIMSFEVPSLTTWRQFAEAALKDQQAKKNSLGRNDALAIGFKENQWRLMFNQFIDNNVVEERRNQKPKITADGALILQRHLTPNPPTPRSK